MVALTFLVTYTSRFPFCIISCQLKLLLPKFVFHFLFSFGQDARFLKEAFLSFIASLTHSWAQRQSWQFSLQGPSPFPAFDQEIIVTLPLTRKSSSQWLLSCFYFSSLKKGGDGPGSLRASVPLLSDAKGSISHWKWHLEGEHHLPLESGACFLGTTSSSTRKLWWNFGGIICCFQRRCTASSRYLATLRVALFFSPFFKVVAQRRILKGRRGSWPSNEWGTVLL